VAYFAQQQTDPIKNNIIRQTRNAIPVRMKKIEAIIRAERMPVVKEQLRQIGIGGMTVSTVSGWSKQRELHLQWRGSPVSYDLIPRTKFETIVQDDKVDEVIQAIVEHARTGEHGDGVVFVSTIEKAVNIATLNRDEKGI
jgi:nitrogen regulatory protein P-II 1